jgi:hypothetical protein
MPNITVTVDQTIYNNARVFAACHIASVSAIVEFSRQNLRSLNFKPGPGIAMPRNRQSRAAAAHAGEQAARAHGMAAFQAKQAPPNPLKIEKIFQKPRNGETQLIRFSGLAQVASPFYGFFSLAPKCPRSLP